MSQIYKGFSFDTDNFKRYDQELIVENFTTRLNTSHRTLPYNLTYGASFVEQLGEPLDNEFMSILEDEVNSIIGMDTRLTQQSRAIVQINPDRQTAYVTINAQYNLLDAVDDVTIAVRGV